MGYEIPRHFYSAALKREAIRRVRHEGKSLDQVAQELALSTTRLAEWLVTDDLLLSSMTSDGSEIYQDEHDVHPAREGTRPFSAVDSMNFSTFGLRAPPSTSASN